MPQASRIYKAEAKKEAIKRFDRFCKRWEHIEPYAVRCFKKNFYDFVEDRNFISTTNHLERDLEEIRRRIKIQGYFKNEKSLNLWIYGIVDQIRKEQQPENMPNCTFTLVKEPKYEIASPPSVARNGTMKCKAPNYLDITEYMYPIDNIISIVYILL